jgi:hypothetical protein
MNWMLSHKLDLLILQYCVSERFFLLSHIRMNNVGSNVIMKKDQHPDFDKFIYFQAQLL